jgi:hypothetical protein
MADPDTTRWTVTVSKRTDLALRAFLRKRGMRQRDISTFIEEAVQWRMLNATRTQVQAAFADLSAEEVDGLVTDVVSATRGRAAKPKASRAALPVGLPG